MASHLEFRRRSSAADRRPTTLQSTLAAMATTTTFAPDMDTVTRSHRGVTSKPGGDGKTRKGRGADIMTPPSQPSADNDPSTRQSRSHSIASRLTNRLSLTLPIAPPTSDASRPTPLSAAASSIPPTPVETSTVAPPSDAGEFIIAIAAQERKVLELREELARAETHLASLKKQWTAREPYRTSDGSHHTGLRRTATPGALDDDDAAIATRRSVELDRRRLLLQSHSQSSTPTQGRRRVLRGGHARALSLLSPARTDSNFSVHEDNGAERMDQRTAQLVNSSVPKRASWQPRSGHNSPVVPQLVEDFKMGLRAFVDDIRQITVGDEPIRGQSGRGTQVQEHGGARSRWTPGDQERARVANAARRKMSPAANPLSSTTPTPTPGTQKAGVALERPKPTRSKPFSWTPLGFDSMDDSDWSNWESPGPAKSRRWSGSTIKSAGLEDIGSIPEVGEDPPTPARSKSTAPAEKPALPAKLEEILPSVVNRLSPSNLKRTANLLMEEWEKSLVAPEPHHGNKENEILKT